MKKDTFNWLQKMPEDERTLRELGIKEKHIKMHLKTINEGVRAVKLASDSLLPLFDEYKRLLDKVEVKK